jgi:hypothetical protein
MILFQKRINERSSGYSVIQKLKGKRGVILPNGYSQDLEFTGSMEKPDLGNQLSCASWSNIRVHGRALSVGLKVVRRDYLRFTSGIVV